MRWGSGREAVRWLAAWERAAGADGAPQAGYKESPVRGTPLSCDDTLDAVMWFMSGKRRKDKAMSANFDPTMQYLRAVSTPGANVRIEWETTVKGAAAHKARVLTKHVAATVRTGIEYAQLSEVREAVEAGERSEVGSLPWGEWKLYPYIVTHKGRDYARLYLADEPALAVTYMVDGVTVSRETFETYLTPGQRKHKPAPLTFTVPVANLRFVAGEAIVAA